jgi:hypothetical protein
MDSVQHDSPAGTSRKEFIQLAAAATAALAPTPLTDVRYTRNPEGAIYGYEQSLANAYMNRLPITTPVGGSVVGQVDLSRIFA